MENENAPEGKLVTAFKSGKWYKWVGPPKRQPNWNHRGEMDFIRPPKETPSQ